jgi:hypothetical protein
MNDRRALPRYEVQIEGKLMSPDMSFCVDVLIKDLSEDGALVSALAPANLVPDRAYLWQAKTRTLFECTVQWRKNQRLLGVQFTGTGSRERGRSLVEAATSVWRRSQAPARPRKAAIHCAEHPA